MIFLVFVVNGEEVEYLHIHEDPNGDIIVDYDEKFNLVKAHVGVVMEKLRDNGINHVHISKNLKYRIISIWLDDLSQLHSVLHVLDIPPLCYELMVDDNILVIDTPDYEKAIGIKNPITLTKKDWVIYA